IVSFEVGKARLSGGCRRPPTARHEGRGWRQCRYDSVAAVPTGPVSLPAGPKGQQAASKAGRAPYSYVYLEPCLNVCRLGILANASATAPALSSSNHLTNSSLSADDNGYNASNNTNSGPPPANPILTGYESYCQQTPLVTRYMGFMNHGVKLEQSLGSSYFAVLFFTLTIATNVLFLAIEILLWGLTNNEAHLLSASMGIWVVLLGIIAAECAQAPPDTIKKLFFLEVKAVYYPMGTSSSWAVYGCNESDVQLPVLLGLFSLLGGPRLSYCLGVAVGYGYGYGKLDRFKVRVERVRKWENRDQNGFLSGFVRRPGFITIGSATGPMAWQEGSGGGRGNDASASSAAGAVRAPEDPGAPSFPSSGGRSLGGSRGGLLSRSPKKTPEERAALLERAAERRRNQQEGELDYIADRPERSHQLGLQLTLPRTSDAAFEV
ncbi:hypothetical protein THAOC_11835, partial [Thalassiosira oceanica]